MTVLNNFLESRGLTTSVVNKPLKLRVPVGAEDLSQLELIKLYNYRSHAVRAAQKHDAMRKQKLIEAKFIQQDLPKLELTEEDFDEIALKAYKTGMLPILAGDEIVLSNNPVIGDTPE